MSNVLSNRAAERWGHEERPPSTVGVGGEPGREGKIGWAIERSLDLPVPAVLAVLWLMGASFIGLCAVASYYSVWVLWTTVA